MIKVWHSQTFQLMHNFVGHTADVTALCPHQGEPLLISASLDGSVRLWRLDTFQMQQRIDIEQPVCGLRLLAGSEIVYWTEDDVHHCQLSLVNRMFSVIQSNVIRLSRWPSTTGKATRILASIEDGSLRLLSPVTGAAVTIVYPVMTHRVLTVTLYDNCSDQLYAYLDGSVLVYDCSTNPCQPRYQLSTPPCIHNSPVQCIALIKKTGRGNVEGAKQTEAFVFAGHKNGTLSLIQADGYAMEENFKAHQGHVTLLATSMPLFTENQPIMGQEECLLSYGSDQLLKIWRVEICGGLIVLNLVGKVSFSKLVKAVCMIGSVICAVFVNSGLVEFYKVYGSEYTGDGARVQPLHHCSGENHTEEVNDVAGCSTLELFVTSSMDRTLKLWDADGQLIRELAFVSPVYGVCFADDRGDILVGFQDHIHFIGIVDYLPLDRLETLVNCHFEDELKEFPLAFTNTCYNSDQGPIYPFNLTDRQKIFKENQLPIQEDPCEFDSESAKDTRSLETIYEKYRHLSAQDGEIQHTRDASPHRSWNEFTKKREDATVKLSAHRERSRNSSRCHRNTCSRQSPCIQIQHQASAVSATESAECAVHSEHRLSAMGPQRRKSSVKLGKTKALNSSRKKGSKKLLDVVATVTQQGEDVETTEQPPDSEDVEAARLEEERLRHAEEQRKKYPVAPDGYVPNSVIRGLLNIHKPKPPAPVEPEKQWKLKPAPVGDTRFGRVQEDPEPEQEDNDVTLYLSDTDLSNGVDAEEEAEVGSVVSGATTGRKEKVITRQTASTPGRKSMVVYEGSRHSKFTMPDLAGSSQASPRQKVASRQGTVASTVISEEDQDDVPPLLRKICSETWFPKSVNATVTGIVSAFTAMLDNVNNATHTKICDYTIQINKEIGFSSTQEGRMVTKLISQLSSKNEIVRGNAVRTLTIIGADRKDVIVALLPLLTDLSDDVRTETQVALQALSGVGTKDDLYRLMEGLKIIQHYSSKEDEDEALEKVATGLLDRGTSRDTALSSEGKVESWLQEAEGVGPDMSGLYSGTEDLQAKPGPETKSRNPRNRKGGARAVFKQQNMTELTPNYGQSAPSEASFSSDSRDVNKSRLLPTNPALYKMLVSQREAQGGSTVPSEQQTEGSIVIQQHHAGDSTSSVHGPAEGGTCSVHKNAEGSTGFEYKPIDGSTNTASVTSGNRNNNASEKSSSSSVNLLKENQEPTDGGFQESDPSGTRHKIGATVRVTKLDDASAHKTSLFEEDSGLGTMTASEAVTSVSSREKPSTVGLSTAAPHGRTNLSPVLSSNVEEIIVDDDVTDAEEENWRQFFNRPSAQERRRLHEEREAQEAAKGARDSINLPPIRYLGDDVELVAGDPGLRLLHTISVKPRSADYPGVDDRLTPRHKIDPIHGKLAATTVAEDFGRTSYGILDLHWTTGVPINANILRRYAIRRSFNDNTEIPGEQIPHLPKVHVSNDPQAAVTAQADSKLPSLTKAEPSFAWGEPLPPAPDRESRLANPKIRQDHKHYCEYYKLLRKRMHDHISKLMNIALCDFPRT